MQYIVLLRGVNIGGHNKVPMKVLSAALKEIDCTDVVTYIQSGNIVLKSDLIAVELQKMVDDVIVQTFGFRVSVQVKTFADWWAILDGNPFVANSEDEQYLKTLNVTFFQDALSDADKQRISDKSVDGEDWVLNNNTLYFWYGNGQARSKLAETVSKIPHGTTRNWRTVTKLAELIG